VNLEMHLRVRDRAKLEMYLEVYLEAVDREGDATGGETLFIG